MAERLRRLRQNDCGDCGAPEDTRQKEKDITRARISNPLTVQLDRIPHVKYKCKYLTEGQT